MFRPIDDLGDDVVGFVADGEIHSDDYKHTLIPAIEDLIRRTGGARVLLVLGSEWSGYSAGAMWADAKLGIEDARKWQRFALVSDADWIKHVARLFGWAVPGEVQFFPTNEIDAAKEWVVA